LNKIYLIKGNKIKFEQGTWILIYLHRSAFHFKCKLSDAWISKGISSQIKAKGCRVLCFRSPIANAAQHRGFFPTSQIPMWSPRKQATLNLEFVSSAFGLLRWIIKHSERWGKIGVRTTKTGMQLTPTQVQFSCGGLS